MAAPAPAPPLSFPHYPELIFAAIDAIDEKDGANKSTISKHIEATYGNLPTAHSTLLSHHLNKMKAAGQLIMVKNNYVKPDPDAPPRRGRGRPPKSKQPLPPDTVLSPPKPRGRPPKPRDPLAPKKVTPSVSGRKRGRPPKLGSSATKGPSPAASGERRGRGRPPKVKASVAAPVGA
ncbi:HMG-Y-related protein A [Cynara cardunculus var. scolymus]|uniref:HMG-Y-related protein A n=1 Tax=Cynara cardunculus var. scolymus TaxID=59895 RepID=A0A103YAD8_CYNCS|nr:HMG-Y-related protein A [Cynara cardunculus var. scolymus]KVI05436.1 AT hook, DNA-binding motif-containing protein [Cynara cardunculus var. scolymus]